MTDALTFKNLHKEYMDYLGRQFPEPDTLPVQSCWRHKYRVFWTDGHSAKEQCKKCGKTRDRYYGD